ncbi:hypothetical protein A3D70_00630 [Candidatus Adlerbacteria bacterium RIFCSPHIGHO2_02_FULL_54_18]|uniref:NlpC/P60 domain-containing protein n=2 Tax=Candidatus Adleribacteriota TaxID=1752736 RepID=A0A1F4Y1Q0_9BACT|nr:MAG: hypothetical protein A2949_01095 [Candidatus Adlerbacteria bacterium RIFCSPLOWO2_01_FULL_54_21b]OGC87794.1 MAG: hypothetical protein A3D70_00630 [Candidatus Adlerbacteria bacterium RIFCSPHIGHO2_02_FULL_54_18]
MKARVLLFMFGGLLFVIPLLVEAQSGLVGCTGAANCNFCAFTGLFQSIINFLIGLSIPLSALLFAWAGILYFSSAANPAGIETAKKIFVSVGIGFLIAMGGWLGVQTILKTLLAQDFYVSWDKIDCRQANRPGSGAEESKTITVAEWLSFLPPLNQTPLVPVTVNSSYLTQPGGAQLTAPPGGGCDAGLALCWDADNNVVDPRSVSISNAATLYYGTDTSAGPDGGNKACVWAVNNVLQGAGVDRIDGDSVELMEREIKYNDRGTLVGDTNNLSNTREGDIVVWKNDSISHVGICRDDGCTRVTSNSSSDKSFTTNTDAGFNRGVQSRIYRVR